MANITTNPPDFDLLINQLRAGNTMSNAAGAPQGKLPNFLKEYRKKYGVGNPVNLSFGIPGGGSSSNSKFERFVRAIAGQESGGNYRAENPHSGALGKYQIMPSNVAAWSKSILGRTLTKKQFLNSPALQEQIARTMLRRYVKKYGYSGAAAAWYGGPGVAKNWARMTNPQGQYPSIANYVRTIMRRMK